MPNNSPPAVAEPRINGLQLIFHVIQPRKARIDALSVLHHIIQLGRSPISAKLFIKPDGLRQKNSLSPSDLEMNLVYDVYHNMKPDELINTLAY